MTNSIIQRFCMYLCPWHISAGFQDKPSVQTGKPGRQVSACGQPPDQDRRPGPTEALPGNCTPSLLPDVGESTL